MSVQIPQFTEDLNIISALADQPTLTSSELKAKFDEASNKIKNYINNILIDGIEDWGDDLKTELEGALQDAIDEFQALLDGLTAGDVAYDNTTSGLTATDVQNAIDEIQTALNTVTSNVNTNLGKKTVYGDFVVTTGSRSDTLAKSSPTSKEYTFTITMNNNGYFPLGIVGFNYVKANVDTEFLRCEITSRTSGRAVITYKLKLNNTIDTTTHTFYFNVLWVKVR